MCVCYLSNAKISLVFMVRVMAQFSVLSLRFYVNVVARWVYDDACVLDVRGKKVIFHFGTACILATLLIGGAGLVGSYSSRSVLAARPKGVHIQLRRLWCEL